MKNSPSQIWLPVLLAIAWIFGGMTTAFFYQKKNDDTTQKDFQQLQEILNYITQHHADNPNVKQMTEEIVKNFLNKLDPHSRYIPPSQLTKAHLGIESTFEGIGISYQIIQDTLTILGILPDSPAQKAKVEIGDKLLKINQKNIEKNVAGKQNCPPVDSFLVWFRGEKNSKINVEFLRNQKKINLNISRNTITSKSIEIAYMVDDKTGFIKIQRFSADVYKEFKETLTQLKNKGATQLILDLRDNGGGYLDKAVNMADELLDGKKKILVTKGKSRTENNNKQNSKNSKNSEAETIYYARINGLFEKEKIVVLINENSASATEIFAGALQDHDRATLIGRKTFGKGLVQMPFVLSNGGELRLTTSRYYTPSGRSIQKPYQDYLKDLLEDYPASLFYKDSIKLDKSQIFKTTNGRTVYGGGGVMPDIFVPLDTALYSQNIENLAEKQAFAIVALDFYKKEKDNFLHISDKLFLKKMNEILAKNQNEILEKMRFLLLSVSSKKITPQEKKNFSNDSPFGGLGGLYFSQKDILQINRNIKAEMARFFNNENLYFKIMSEEDDVYKKALGELRIEN